MFRISFKTIIHNKSRFLCTVIGFFVATVILVFGIYYLYVSNRIANESFETTLAEQRVLLDDVVVNGAEYYDTEDGFVEHITPITRNMLWDIASSDGVDSVCAVYMRNQSLRGKVENTELDIMTPEAVDPEYALFSGAIIDSVAKGEKGFKPIVAGDGLDKDNPYSVLVSESTVKVLGYSNEEIIGKTLLIWGENDKEYLLTIQGVYAHELSGSYRVNLSEFEYWGTTGTPLFYGVEFLFHKGFFEELSVVENGTKSLTPSRLHVHMKEQEKIESFIEAMVQKYSLRSSSDYMSFYRGIEQRTKQASLFITFGVVIFALSIVMNFNTVLIHISQQRRFIRLLRLMGYSKLRIHTVHVLQSMLYGVIGSGVGCLIAYVICTVLGKSAVISFGEAVINPSVFLLPVQYPLVILVLTVLANIVSGFIISVVKVNRMEKGKA